MNIAGIVVIFVLVWWCTFFALLPIGVQSRWESDSDGIAGADPGAPTNPQLKKKALWATAAAVVGTAAIMAVVLSGVINFRD